MEEKTGYESDKPQNTMLGEIEWSHLFRPDYEYKKDGAWSLGLKIGGAGKDPILAIVREAAGLKSQSERCTEFAKPPFIENEDGTTTFKFTQNAVIKMDGKQDSHTKIDVYDAKMNPWPRDVEVGKGSKVKVRYKASSWNVQQQGGVGVTLRLIAVQVINHVPYIASHGFEEEEGVDMGMGSGAHPNEGAGGNGDIPMGDAPGPAGVGTDPAKPYEKHTSGPVTPDVPF